MLNKTGEPFDIKIRVTSSTADDQYRAEVWLQHDTVVYPRSNNIMTLMAMVSSATTYSNQIGIVFRQSVLTPTAQIAAVN